MFSKKNLLSVIRTTVIALVVLANAAVILPASGCARSNASPQMSANHADSEQTILASDREAARASKHGPKLR